MQEAISGCDIGGSSITDPLKFKFSALQQLQIPIFLLQDLFCNSLHMSNKLLI